eukprot:5813700-Pleurochrysis_carterae.AAC.1
MAAACFDLIKLLPWPLISFLEPRNSSSLFDCTPSGDTITLLLADAACSAFRLADETARACVAPTPDARRCARSRGTAVS